MGLSWETKQATSPPLPIHLPSQFSLKNSITALLKCEGAHHVVATFVMLQMAHTPNAAIIHFRKDSCNMGMLNVAQ
jgi:hypothetical protein